MNVTILKYEEVLGECYNIGELEVTHDFIDEESLKQYLRENWFNIENADRIKKVVVSPYTDGDFKLTLDIIHK